MQHLVKVIQLPPHQGQLCGTFAGLGHAVEHIAGTPGGPMIGSMPSLEVSPGERAAGAIGALIGLLVLAVCLDLMLDGALFGWMSVPASSTTEGDSE